VKRPVGRAAASGSRSATRGVRRTASGVVGVGATARGAILIHGGLIREWFRLPDDPSQDPNKVPSSDSSA